MKAAFRGLRRKASAGDVEGRRQAYLAEQEEPWVEVRAPAVPRLPDLGRASPMPSLRFLGLGLDNFVSSHEYHSGSPDTSALEIEDDLAQLGRDSAASASSAATAVSSPVREVPAAPATQEAGDTDDDDDDEGRLTQRQQQQQLHPSTRELPDTAAAPETSARQVSGEQFPSNPTSSPSSPALRSQHHPSSQRYHLLDVTTAPEAAPMPRSDTPARAVADASRAPRPSRTRTSSKRSDRRQRDFHLIDADEAADVCDDDDDNHSIEAVRNYKDHNHHIATTAAEPRSDARYPQPAARLDPPRRSIRHSVSQPALEPRPRGSRSATMPAPPVLAPHKTNIPVSAGAPAQSSVSTILSSTRKAKAPATPTPAANEPPTAPSLFAYESGPGSGIKSAAKFKTFSSKSSAKSIHNSKGSERSTIRNARCEIEWKDPPPPTPAPTQPLPTAPSVQHLGGLAYQHQVYQAQQRGVPVESLGGAAEIRHTLDRFQSKSTGRVDKLAGTAGRQDSWSPGRDPLPLPSSSTKVSSPSQIPYRAIGTASLGADHNPGRSSKPSARDGLRGMAASISSGKLLRMGSRKPKAGRSEDSNETPGDSSRDTAPGGVTEEDRLEAEERRKAEQWGRDREARNAADRLEATEKKRRQEEEAMAKRASELAAAKREEQERREKEAEEAAEQERIAKEKRAAEKAARKEAKERAEREAEQRRIEEEKHAEERRIRRAKAAEEKRIARQEEEEQREREAKEDAKRQEIEAIEAEERQLADAHRQVEEEDRLARKAGRRDARRTKRARAAGVEVDDLSESEADEDDLSDNNQEVFADAEEMERTQSDARAPSSVESSADFPVTPADETADALQNHQWGKVRPDAAQGVAAGHISSASETDTEGSAAKKAQDADAYRSDRFRAAVSGGARRITPGTTPAMTPAIATDAEPSAADKDLDDQIVQPNGPYREGGITYSRGWSAHGLADPTLLIDHRRIVRTLRAAPSAEREADEAAAIEGEATAQTAMEATDEKTEPSPDATDAATEPDYDEAVYSDLGELIWSSTTPDVIARLVGFLDYADVKALRQTSQSIRFALSQLAGREIVLSRFLGQVGYLSWNRSWTTTASATDASHVVKDPLPLSFSDCEAFLLSYDLLPEYRLVGAEYAKALHKMDPRYPRLARATTRSYNRVLARLRMQPTFDPPSFRSAASQLSPITAQGHFRQQQVMVAPANRSPDRSPALGAIAAFGGADASSTSKITSPWKPGRAALFRVWVPSAEESGWLSDAELTRCERELFIAGVWSFMKRGDVVWDCAIGDERNVGKYMFDGRYLRDLSYMFDRTGHLPSWINAFSYAPSYYHNIIRSSSAQPVVYLDVLPWRDQIVSTMRLVQDQVETFNPQGARYRISKWLYRAVINVVPGQIISDEGLEVVDGGWHGRIFIETEGTAEHAKELISRCAGPAESAQTKARLLASVMDADGQPRIPKAPAPTRDAAGQKIETTTPWAIIRARSRPGMIWIRPLDMRERVSF